MSEHPDGILPIPPPDDDLEPFVPAPDDGGEDSPPGEQEDYPENPPPPLGPDE